MANKNFFKSLSQQEERLKANAGKNPYGDMSDSIKEEDFHNVKSEGFSELDTDSANKELDLDDLDEDEEFMPSFEEVMNSRKSKAQNTHQSKKIEEALNLEALIDDDSNDSFDSFIEKENSNSSENHQFVDLNKENEELKQTLQEMNEKFKEVSEENVSLKNLKSSMESEISKLEKENSNLNSDIESLKIQNHDISEKLDDAYRNIENLQKQNVESFDGSKFVEIEKLNEAQNLIQKLNEKIEQYKEDYKEVNNGKRSATLRATNLEKANKKLEEELEELKEKLKNQEKKEDVVEKEDIKLNVEPTEVSNYVLSFVCYKTIKNMSETYKSEIYTDSYAKKLFGKYISGELDGTDPLFSQLIQEAVDSNVQDPYLEKITESVLKHIQNEKRAKDLIIDFEKES